MEALFDKKPVRVPGSLVAVVSIFLSASAFSSDYTAQHPAGGFLQNAEATRNQGGVGNHLFRYYKGKDDKSAATMPRTEDEISYEQSSTERAEVKESDRLFFSRDSAEIKAADARKVEELSKKLKEDADRKAYIYGYADSVGPPEYNETLSQKRARAVYDELRSRGVASSQLHWEGRGSIESDSSMATLGNSEDRRVEIEVE